MQIKSIVAGAAIALAATIGSASAADQFTTLAGVPAQPLTVDAVENAASNRFAALEGIAAEPLSTADMGAVVGRLFPQCINVVMGEPIFACGRGCPQRFGPLPAVIINGTNVTGG